MGPRLVAALAAAALGPGCLFVPTNLPRPVVWSFDIQGTAALDADDLKERLATRASGRFFWEQWHEYDEDALAADVRRIERYCQAQGYYQARVTGVEVRPAGQGRVDIAIELSEGPPVRVREVAVTGMEGAPGVRLPRLPLAPGDVFSEARFDAGRAALLEALHGQGYARAEVAQRAQVDAGRTTARVTFAVTPGERYRFGNVFVAGTVAVPRVRVREEAETVIAPGAVFDERLLPKAQARVFDLGVFGGVRLAQGGTDDERKAIPVVVAVREAPFRTVRLGPGIAIQATSRWDVHVLAGWQDRNFLGGLRRLSIGGTAGYAWLPNPFAPTRQGFVGNLTTQFTQPGALGRWLDLDVSLNGERGLEPTYDYWAERLRLGLPLRLGRVWTVVPSYNLELYQLGGSSLLTVSSGEVVTSNLLFLQGCPNTGPASSTCDILLSFFEQRLGLDLRDDPINTRSGGYLGLALQEGFTIGSNGFSYFRVLPEARGFLPLGRSVLAARLRIGILVPIRTDPGIPQSQQTPIVARFTAGGPSSMRGYYTAQLAPVVNVCTQGAGPSGECLAPEYQAVGGNGLIDGSLELRFGISGNLGGAVFFDFGNVAATSSDITDLRALQYAVGIGLRYRTPLGPVRVDLAGNLPKRGPSGWERAGVPVLNAQPDGTLVDSGAIHHPTIFGLHLSIGEAF